MGAVLTDMLIRKEPLCNRKTLCISFSCLLGLILSIIWAMIIAAAFMSPYLPKFKLDWVSVTNPNISQNCVNANWDFLFIVTNPNQEPFFYDRIDASLYHNQNNVANASVAPFEHGGEKMAIMHTRFESMSLEIDKSWGSFGEVILSVVWCFDTRFGGSMWPIKRDAIKVGCEELRVVFSSDVTEPTWFRSYRCDVNGLWRAFSEYAHLVGPFYLMIGSVIAFILMFYALD